MHKYLKNKLVKFRLGFKERLNRPTGFLIFNSSWLILISTLILIIFSDKVSINYKDLFSVSATIIATIFTISLTLIGIQYFVQNIPYELLKYFFKSKFMLAMFITFIGSIIYNLLMLSLDAKNIILLIISISLSIISLVYLLSYFYYLNSSLQEISILNLITQNLRKKSYKKDYGKYEALKDLIIKSIKDNKNSLYKRGLNILFQKEFSFLMDIAKRTIDERYTYDHRHSDVEQLIHFFLGFQKQIFYELIEHKRQLYLYHYIEYFKELQEKSFVLLSPRPYYELSDHFNKVGNKILENRFDEVYLVYSHRIREITQYEYNHVNKKKLVSYYDIEKRDKDETEPQKNERVLIHMMYESFEERLNFLTELSKKAIRENVNILNWFPKSILCDILYKAVGLTENKGMRWLLIQKIMYLLKQIHEENINNNKFDRFLFSDLYNYIKPMKNLDDINKLGGFITREYCLAQLNLIKINPREVVRELGVNGRFLKDEEKYDIVIKLLMETFDRILKMLFKKEIKNIEKDYISSEIHSILGKSVKNNKLVKAIIEKHKLKPSKNVYLMGIYMGTKKEFQRKNKKRRNSDKNNKK